MALIELIAGVDEVGRGPLAGPVLAAVVILDPARPIHGLADVAEVEEIDHLNILQATLLAMRRAVLGLPEPPVLVQVDGTQRPALPMAVQTVVRGDASVPAISAASILAKVRRDRLCAELHAHHPQYGFDVHKGYPTAAHLEALRRHGPCAAHRRSFGPVAQVLKGEGR